jgi:hypothetical protein
VAETPVVEEKPKTKKAKVTLNSASGRFGKMNRPFLSQGVQNGSNTPKSFSRNNRYQTDALTNDGKDGQTINVQNPTGAV